MNGINKIIKRLKNSPIYAMSLGSKELFHSNFWAWLIDQNNEYAKIFFKEIDCSNVIVEREKNSRDITLTSQKKKYVIENKLKSMPDKDQLIKYTNDVGKSFDGGFLTGIKKPNFDLPKGWSFVSYQEITDGIETVVNQSNDNEFNKKVILQYIDDLRNIFELISEFDNITGENFPNSELNIVKKLSDKSIRLWDVCQKYKVEEFAKQLKKELQELEVLVAKNGFTFFVETGFSHSTSFVDIRFIRDREEESEVSIGVQLQNGQYRKCAVLSGNNSVENVYNVFKGYGWFEEYDRQRKIIFNQESSMTKPYCSFKGGTKVKYYFVDQHYKIFDYSFADLTERIRKDLIQAIEVINKNYKK